MYFLPSKPLRCMVVFYEVVVALLAYVSHLASPIRNGITIENEGARDLYCSPWLQPLLSGAYIPGGVLMLAPRSGRQFRLVIGQEIQSWA